MTATFLVFVTGGCSAWWRYSRWSAAARLSQQMAIGLPSILLRRQTGSQGRAQVRPSTPGTTFDLRLSRYASSKRAWEMRPIYVATSVWAGQPTWQGIFV